MKGKFTGAGFREKKYWGPLYIRPDVIWEMKEEIIPFTCAPLQQGLTLPSRLTSCHLLPPFHCHTHYNPHNKRILHKRTCNLLLGYCKIV
jgi:hypothetical protein